MTPLPEDVRARFDGPNQAHVATMMLDRGPHCVLVGPPITEAAKR